MIVALIYPFRSKRTCSKRMSCEISEWDYTKSKFKNRYKICKAGRRKICNILLREYNFEFNFTSPRDSAVILFTKYCFRHRRFEKLLVSRYTFMYLLANKVASGETKKIAGKSRPMGRKRGWISWLQYFLRRIFTAPRIISIFPGNFPLLNSGRRRAWPYARLLLLRRNTHYGKRDSRTTKYERGIMRADVRRQKKH